MDKEFFIRKITKWCAYQDRSEYETIQKLLSWGVDEKLLNEIIQYLKEENYLNEKRFVNAFINGKIHSKKWGVEKVKYHLKHKHHIPTETIDAILREIDYEKYLHQLQQLLMKKKQILEKKEDDKYLLKKKIINFALSKGYQLDEIIKALQDINW